MTTEIVKNPSQEAIQRAADLLKEGKLVVFPTETVYGLGASALDASAAARIYAAKGRPSDKRIEKEEKAYDLLEKCGIEFERVDHDAANTIEECLEVDELLSLAEKICRERDALCENIEKRADELRALCVLDAKTVFELL